MDSMYYSDNDSWTAEEDSALLFLQQWELQSNLFQAATERIAFKFMVAFAVAGCIAVLINVMVVIILVLHRRRALRHVFYILVFNFAVIDTLRGICLILWSLRILKPVGQPVAVRLALMKIDQISLMVLRFCSLATIINLVYITLNEYLFIHIPLQYYRLINRFRAMLLIAANWIICLGFVLAGTYARNASRGIQTVFVPENRSNIMDEERPAGVRRLERGGEIYIQTIFNFTLLGFCFICLVFVLVCYISLIATVKRIRHHEDALRKESVRKHSSSSCVLGFEDPTTDEKRLKRQILKRYKHAVVIGLVIAIYLLYLVSYGVIQLLHYFRLRLNTYLREDEELVVRLSMQLVFGLHAMLQPLCYFRMREFRRMVKLTLQLRLHQKYVGMSTNYDPTAQIPAYEASRQPNQSAGNGILLHQPQKRVERKLAVTFFNGAPPVVPTRNDSDSDCCLAIADAEYIYAMLKHENSTHL